MSDINPENALSVDLLSDEEAQDEAVVALLLTRPGERIYRPRYGTGFSKFLHRPATRDTEIQIRNEGILSVQFNEPDIPIDVSESEVRRLDDGQTYEIDLRINLRSIRTNLGVNR